MNRLGISIAALFVLVLLVYMPVWLTEPTTTQSGNSNDALKPAYTAKNLTTTLYNEEGALNHQVFAKTMEHYDQLGFVQFEEPKYTVYVNADQSPWQVTSNEGTLYNNNLIELESQVRVRSFTEDAFVKTIETDFIKINLDDKTLFSDQPVVIRGATFVVNSNGIKGDLSSQEYELIDHVQTTFSPGL